MEPKHEHDCENCTFVGHVLEHDLYVCLSGRKEDPGSVIARYGTEGDYASQPIGMLLDTLRRGFDIGDHTREPAVHTHVPFTSSALLILALSLAREKGLTRWEAAA